MLSCHAASPPVLCPDDEILVADERGVVAGEQKGKLLLDLILVGDQEVARRAERCLMAGGSKLALRQALLILICSTLRIPYLDEAVMQKIIGVTELQRSFRAVLDEVAQRRVPYSLTRGSRPEAVIIPYDDFVRFQELQEQATLARFDRLLARMATENAQYSEDEVAADVEAARSGT